MGNKFIAVRDFDDGDIEVTSVTLFDVSKEEMKKRISEGVDRMVEELDLDDRELPLNISRQILVGEDELFDLIDTAVPIDDDEISVLEKFGLGSTKQWDITRQLVEG